MPESLQSNSNTQIPNQNSNTINVNYHNPDTVNSGALSDQQSYQLYVQGRAKPAGPDGDLEDANVVGKISFYSPKTLLESPICYYYSHLSNKRAASLIDFSFFAPPPPCSLIHFDL